MFENFVVNCVQIGGMLYIALCIGAILLWTASYLLESIRDWWRK